MVSNQPTTTYSPDQVMEIVNGDETIAQRVLRLAREKKTEKEIANENEVETSYQDCKIKIFTLALNKLSNVEPGKLHWVQIGYYHGGSSGKEDEKESYEIGNAIATQFKNGKHKQLEEDLAKQGLQIRFSYKDSSDIVSEKRPGGVANLPLSEFEQMPAHKSSPLQIDITTL